MLTVIAALLAVLLVAVVSGFSACWWELRGLRMGEYSVWPSLRPRRNNRKGKL